MSSIADKILKLKYAIREDESWEELAWRVASFVASAEKEELQEEYSKLFYNIIAGKFFIPGGRILKNSGTGIKNLFNCYAKGTPVVTKRGIVNIEDLIVGEDEVLTHEGRFRKVTNKKQTGFEKTLLNVVVDKMPNCLYVTKDQELLTNRGWIEAQNITKEDFIYCPNYKDTLEVPEYINVLDYLDSDFEEVGGKIVRRNKVSEFEFNQSLKEINSKIKVDENLAKFLGYFISEGCATDNQCGISFTFSSGESDFIEECVELSENIFGIKPKVTNNGSWKQVLITSKTAQTFMKNWIGDRSTNKKLPFWVLNTDNNFKINLLAYMFRGDGHYYKTYKASVSLTMCNPTVMFQAYLIAKDLGFKVSLKSQTKVKKPTHTPAFTLRISGSFNKSENYTKFLESFTKDSVVYSNEWNRVIEVKEVEYNDFVYDIEVEEDHSFQIMGMVGKNCFFFNIEDSRESIYQCLKDAAEIFAWGGGLGLRISNLREEGALIKTSGTPSSGAVSFLELFNLTGDVIQQASRRAAEIALLDISHPDILKFINYKSTLSNKNQLIYNDYVSRKGKEDELLKKTLIENQLSHFNISVEVTDKFMEAVINDDNWELISPSTGEVKEVVSARQLLRTIAESIWRSGDPGLFFVDNVKKDNMVKYISEVVGTNPCLYKDTLMLDGDRLVKISEGGNTFVSWKTGEKETIKLTTNAGYEIIVTPDHKIMLPDGTFEEAQNLLNKEIYWGDWVPLEETKELKEKFNNRLVVTSIEPCGVQEVWDFSNNTHYNLANGFTVHNCGEINLLSYEPCDLGSINLAKFVTEDGKIDLESMMDVIALAIRFLDNIHDISDNRVEKINEMSRGLRRVGLGVMGFADMLAMLNIPYDSEEALVLSETLSKFISKIAWVASSILAVEKGTFPYFDKDKADWHVIEKVFEGDEFINFIKENGVRNVSVTALAPTGSIALLAEVNSCIEPYFALAYKRYITEGIGNFAKDTIIEVNPILKNKLEEIGIFEKVKERILKEGSIQKIEEIPVEIRKVFKTAHDISPLDHIRIQSAWQKYISNAISKTINLPHNATPEDIYNYIIQMWKYNLKSSTFYRDGSKDFQILNRGV